MGDSAITETFGIGGAAMIAARGDPFCRRRRNGGGEIRF